MKKTNLFFCMIGMLMTLGFPAYGYNTTSSEVPTGIAVGPGMFVEVSFPTMINPESCGYSGAYQVDTVNVDTATRKAMLAVLVQAKASNTPVRVRLDGCSDRPLITYIFTDEYP